MANMTDDLSLYVTDLYNKYFVVWAGYYQNDKDKVLMIRSLFIISIWLLFPIMIHVWNKLNRRNRDDYGKGKIRDSGSEHDTVVVDSDNDSDVVDNDDDDKSSLIALAFCNIELLLYDKKKKMNRMILNGSINGYVRTGRMLAILGPSGAGKTSLLHALAGRMKYHKYLQLHGQRYINDTIPLSNDSLVPSSAFIEQDVLFFPYMTVYETLCFRYQLSSYHYYHIGSNENNTMDQMIQHVLQRLDLHRVADTIVGDAGKIRGISGGERKRLSIAVQIVSMKEPSLLFLDEPTSGLDYTSAYQLIQLLRNMTNKNNNSSSHNNNENANLISLSKNKKKMTTIIAVLHQPSQSILNMFDDVLLLGHGGQQMFYGSRDSVRHYLEFDGQCDTSSNEIGTTEHCLNCISFYPMNEHEMKNETLIRERIERLTHLSNTVQKSNIMQVIIPTNHTDDHKGERYLYSTHGPNIPFFRQFAILLRRSWNEVKRSKMTIILYMIRLISMALIYGSIYQLKLNQSSIQDRFGLLSLLVIGGMNMGLSKTIRTFPREKIIVTSELSQHLYGTLPYFIAKAISEIPVTIFLNTIFSIVVYYMTGLDRIFDPNKIYYFIGLCNLHAIVSESVGLFMGAISPNSDIALAMYPAIVVLSIIFDGKNISNENIPYLLRWIPKIGIVKWAFEGLCMNEFDGLIFVTTTNVTENNIKQQRNPRNTYNVNEGYMIQTGTQALERYGLKSEHTLWDVAKAQIAIALVCWLLSYMALTIRKQKFVVMQKPLSKTE